MASPAPAPSNITAGIVALPTPSGSAQTTTEGSAAAAIPTTPRAVKTTSLPTITLQRTEPPKTLRGLNKPKCIKCGNVARSSFEAKCNSC